MPLVQGRTLALRNRAYEALARIPGLHLVSAAPGSVATALVAARLPEGSDSSAFRGVLRMAERRWFNGFRLSPHIFNDEEDVDRALFAIRQELTR